MTPLLRRPILIGGLGLTFGALALGSLDATLSHWGGPIVWGTIALGSGLWWLQQRTTQSLDLPKLPLAPIDRAAVDRSFATVEQRIQQLITEMGGENAETTDTVVGLRQQLATLTQSLERQQLKLSVMGGRSTGKSAISQLLQNRGLPTEALTDSLNSHQAAVEAASASTEVDNADVVLFLTTGDVTDSEFQTIQNLITQRYRVLLLFNKQDQYLPDDRPVILQQLRQRVEGVLPAADVLGVSAQPAPIKVRQVQADGSSQERIEQPPSDIAALQERLGHILSHETTDLIYATVFRQSQALLRTVQTELNRVRRDRSLPVIEQYQWIAAAATFANPVSSLDLLATATINAQLIMDLGAIYQQKFSLEQAKAITGTLASQMVKLGLVEVASQAIAPLLKTHALTYVAGGLLQGISAAYLTRVAGLSLVEYFEEQSYLPEAERSGFQVDRLIQKIKSVFEDNGRSVFVQNLVKQGIDRLVPRSESVAPSQA